MKVLLILAMQDELLAYTKRLECETTVIEGIKVYTTKVNNVDLFMAKTEVGKVNAAVLTTLLIKKIKPKYVINAGIAGGLVPSVNLLDVIASTKVAYHDVDLTQFGYQPGQLDDGPTHFEASKKLLSLVANDVKKGLIVSGDQFVSKQEQIKRINRDFPKALCCEMEGCAIGHASSLLSKKFLIIRCISDNPSINKDTAIYHGEYKDYRQMAIDKASEYTIDLIKKL